MEVIMNNDELKDRKSDKQIITEKSGKKKVIEVNKGKSFSDRNHSRKNDNPVFSSESPTADRK